MRLDIIAGARPNFVKIAPIIKAIKQSSDAQSRIIARLIHTGQHYDNAMSGSFFADLGIDQPDINLGVGSGSQASQTGDILKGYENVLLQAKSDLCLVVGDVNSTLACAITARKCGVAVAHVEAGIRSGDWGMPEEINRVVTDSVSNWFYTTSSTANNQLASQGIASERIVFAGNTMIDTLLQNRDRFRQPTLWSDAGLVESDYLVLTLHRPSNVDDSDFFEKRLQAIATAADKFPVVFPVHPRTRAVLDQFEHLPANIIISEPLGYLEFNYLVSRSRGVITDSGGITEEATVLGIPCITMRDSTERPETVSIGTNELIGTELNAIAPWIGKMVAGDWKSGSIPERWDGRAGERIVEHLLTL